MIISQLSLVEFTPSVTLVQVNNVIPQQMFSVVLNENKITGECFFFMDRLGIICCVVIGIPGHLRYLSNTLGQMINTSK